MHSAYLGRFNIQRLRMKGTGTTQCYIYCDLLTYWVYLKQDGDRDYLLIFRNVINRLHVSANFEMYEQLFKDTTWIYVLRTRKRMVYVGTYSYTIFGTLYVAMIFPSGKYHWKVYKNSTIMWAELFWLEGNAAPRNALVKLWSALSAVALPFTEPGVPKRLPSLPVKASEGPTAFILTKLNGRAISQFYMTQSK